jgi:hypothetical protein
LDGRRDTQNVLADLAALQVCGRSHRDKNVRLVVEEWSREIEREDLEQRTSSISPNQLRSSDILTIARNSKQSPGGNLSRTRGVTPIKPSVPTPAITPLILRQTLQIEEGYNLNCHGHPKSRCKMLLSGASYAGIDNTVVSLATYCSTSPRQDNVK